MVDETVYHEANSHGGCSVIAGSMGFTPNQMTPTQRVRQFKQWAW